MSLMPLNSQGPDRNPQRQNRGHEKSKTEALFQTDTLAAMCPDA